MNVLSCTQVCSNMLKHSLLGDSPANHVELPLPKGTPCFNHVEFSLLNFIESSFDPGRCDPLYLEVGAGQSNDYSKEPIKAS